MIQGVVLFAGLIVILFNLAVDLLYPVVDARVRLGART
jgi:peptide/nickel transport system permease protein